MINNSQAFQEFELNQIKSDLVFYLNLIIELNKHKSMGVLVFGLAPYISLFKVETYKYIQENFPQHINFLSSSKKHEDITKSSRMRIKFFDDKEKRIDGIFEVIQWITKFQEWHINQHKGILGPLKRLLQDDFGAFLYDGHMIGSTHTGLFNLGYEEENFPKTPRDNFEVLGELVKSVSIEVGEYLGKIYQLPEFTPTEFENHFNYGIKDDILKYKDEKSKNFLLNIFNGIKTEELNFSLLLLLTTINFFEYILKQLTIGNPSTIFKLKYITLYHTVSSLRKLQSYYYPKNLLEHTSKKYFETILQDEKLKQVSQNSKFRNTLTHYKVDNIPDKLLKINNLSDLVKYSFNDESYDEIDQILDEQISRLSRILEEWFGWKIKEIQLRSW